jgi:uncharacterized iron-regulated protein
MTHLKTLASMVKPANKGLSAKALLAKDPENARQLADYLDAHRDELVQEMVGRLHTQPKTES